MSPVGVTFLRTLGAARGFYHTAFAVAGFIAAAAAVFAFNLESAEGGRLSLAAVWAESVSVVLPVLSALLCMDVWSEERRTGTVDVLLTAPVRERDLVTGKFFGCWTLGLSAIALFWFVSVVTLGWLAPSFPPLEVSSFLPAFFVLAMQSALWCAITVAASAVFTRSAAAAVSALAVTAALPRCGWAALQAWAPQGRTVFGVMPLDAHALDFASGTVSSAVLVSYPLLTVWAIFVASKIVMSLRLVGRGARGLRWSTALTVALSTLAAALAVSLAFRLNVTIDLPRTSDENTFSARTLRILAESEGDIVLTAFVPRSHPRFREIARFLRSFSRMSESNGGARISVRFVDPRWDYGDAQKLARRGVEENSLVFEKGRRLVSIAFSDGCDERACATAVRRLTAPSQRRAVCWTYGHGESGFDVYGPWGMSDIARELVREGYVNKSVDLAADGGIPPDCALIVVAGAKTDFSRVEIGRLDAYLKQGGRLLALMSSPESGGVSRLLPTWGVHPAVRSPGDVRTLSGSDVIVSDFSDHVVARGLDGTQIVLERPAIFEPSAAAGAAAKAESIEFSPIASIAGKAVAVAAERGAGVGGDLGLRPTRIIAVGDATFAMNAQLSSRANANRDFLLNCVAFLSGTEVAFAGGESGVLITGLDRGGRLYFLIAGAVVAPSVLFAVMAAMVAVRRRGE
jgi:ABC-2 type transport system permease protein